MVPELPGSYEEGPPSLSDIAVRDRRWCQGNLQHAAVLPARGLHWVSRLHLLTGIGSYVTAPMWLLFLLVGVAVSLQARFVPPEYFGREPSLFPLWPAQDPVRSMWVFAATMGILLLPKLLAYAAAMTRGADRRGCGGALRAFASLLVETVITGLIAPVTMLIQSIGVLSILLGRDSGWHPQRRDDGSIPLGEVTRRYAGCTVFGLTLGVASYLVAPALLLWMSPVVLGLALAIPLAAVTAAPGPGRALRRWGLLRTPEEHRPAAVLARACELYAALRETGDPLAAVPGEAVERLARDPRLRAAHLAMLPPPRRPRRDPIDAALLVGLVKLDEAEGLKDALAALSGREKAAVLADRRGVERLMALAGAA
jgi:membrane glycosyltransferase